MSSIDFLDVAESTRELRFNFFVAETLLGSCVHVVDHRIPDGTAVLQKVKVHGPMRAKCL